MIAGRYSLTREIGRGGMGAVWLGRDEVLGREVALKQIGLLPGADSTDLARAEREARLTARLNHPHVVGVFDLVVDTERGSRWLVMEYVDGLTLAQLVRTQGPLSPDAAAPLMWQAADALVAAHHAGIVHRDVKPSNILVDRDLRVKLSDFGIARISTDASLTQTGLVTGSPAYLAPEAASGQRGDEAVDVWSLGATLFHVLSGRPPYDSGDHALAGLYRIVHEQPPRLTDAGWLTPLLGSTMVKDPQQRWTMTEVRDFLSGSGRESVDLVPAASVEPPPEVERTSTQEISAGAPRRSARWPAIVAVVALALALVAGLVLAGVRIGDRGTSASTAVTAPAGPSGSSSGGSTSTSPSASPGATTQEATTQGATTQGMESFIRGYVAAVATDPDSAWTMLTPRFQEESGGLATYRRFWGPVGSGRILALSADPDRLLVSYRVRFEGFGTGRRTTVLKLVHEKGRYLIDQERTES